MLPFKYGLTSSVAAAHRWVFCRIQAFAPQSAFSGGNSLVCVGDPVVGFVEPTNRKPKSAHLAGWSKSPFGFWRLPNPDSFPIRFELNPNALYFLPHLPGEGFNYARLPKTNFLFLDALVAFRSQLTAFRNPNPAFLRVVVLPNGKLLPPAGMVRRPTQLLPRRTLPHLMIMPFRRTFLLLKEGRIKAVRSCTLQKVPRKEKEVTRKAPSATRNIEYFITTAEYIQI